MTNREFFNAVISNEITDEVIAHATSSLEKLDARNAARKEKPSKKSLENEPIKAKIAEVLTDEPKTASDIASELELSVQKVSALLRQMDITVVDVKVKGKGTQKGYSL